MAKKTSQAQYEANQRYREKTYKQIGVTLRLDEDYDIIKSWETCTKELGCSNREWVRIMFDAWNEKKK